MPRAALAALAGATLVAPASALAVEPKEEAALVSGIEDARARRRRRAGLRERAAVRPPPRRRLLVWGTSVAVAVLENQQVVPRVQGFVSTPGGRLAVLPTLFVETGGVFSVGARMIADLGPVATGLRLGFGGVHSFEIEPRMTFRLDVPLSTINVEGLYKQDNDLEYLGVGQVPERDPDGPLMGMGVGWLVGVGDSARVGGSGAHLYGGYLLWLSPTRFGLYLRGDAGMGGVTVWDGEKPFVHVGIAAGLKWRVPSVMVLDASGGYDVGPSVTLDPAGSARPPSFAWHGPSARLTFAIDNQLLPRTSGYTEQMPCIMVGCDEHAR